MDEISHEDEDWFGHDYDYGYVHVPKDSTKSIMYLIKDGRVIGIGSWTGWTDPCTRALAHPCGHLQSMISPDAAHILAIGPRIAPPSLLIFAEIVACRYVVETRIVRRPEEHGLDSMMANRS